MPVRREDILDAIRAGASTSTEIGQRIGSSAALVAIHLNKMRKTGQVASKPHPTLKGITGQPSLIWRIVEGWRPQRKVSPETRAMHSARMIARRADPALEARRLAAYKATTAANKIEVPSWVRIAAHRRIYRQIALVLGEEVAAEWARKAKAMLSSKSNGGQHARMAQAHERVGADDSLRAG